MRGNDPTGTQFLRWWVLAKTLAKIDIALDANFAIVAWSFRRFFARVSGKPLTFEVRRRRRYHMGFGSGWSHARR
jgi:hypothetical protein